jgi:hypothetical protein
MGAARAGAVHVASAKKTPKTAKLPMGHRNLRMLKQYGVNVMMRK